MFKGKYRVESARLPGWNYGSAGWYFLTVCTRKHECSLGGVVDGEMRLSPAGRIVADEWQRTETVRPGMQLDAWCVMPNHLHGIVVIQDDKDAMVETPRWGVSKATAKKPKRPRLKRQSLSSVIGQFKSVCTKRIRAAGFRELGWQTRFYDHIIRDEKSLNEIREYIVYNAAKWEFDRENPENLRTRESDGSPGGLPSGDVPPGRLYIGGVG